MYKTKTAQTRAVPFSLRYLHEDVQRFFKISTSSVRTSIRFLSSFTRAIDAFVSLAVLPQISCSS